MIIMNEFDFYKLYISLKAHFLQSNFNIFENYGRIKTYENKFQKSGSYWKIKKLVKKYPKTKDALEFMVSNFVSGDSYGGLFSDTSEKNYKLWKNKVESLQYNFKQDLERLKRYSTSFNELIKVQEKPLILQAYLDKTISLESLVIIDCLTNFSILFNSELKDYIIWPELEMLMKKYKPFLEFDMNTYREIYEKHY